MILVDTSVWIGFLRGSKRAVRLSELLTEDRVATHPWVIGELAMGWIDVPRASFLSDLSLLPSASRVAESELLAFVEARGLFASGLGWVDAQLLASALVDGLAVWSFDRALRLAAGRLGLEGPEV